MIKKVHRKAKKTKDLTSGKWNKVSVLEPKFGRASEILRRPIDPKAHKDPEALKESRIASVMGFHNVGPVIYDAKRATTWQQSLPLDFLEMLHTQQGEPMRQLTQKLIGRLCRVGDMKTLLFDLKPENVLVGGTTEVPVVKLIDFDPKYMKFVDPCFYSTCKKACPADPESCMRATAAVFNVAFMTANTACIYKNKEYADWIGMDDFLAVMNKWLRGCNVPWVAVLDSCKEISDLFDKVLFGYCRSRNFTVKKLLMNQGLSVNSFVSQRSFPISMFSKATLPVAGGITYTGKSGITCSDENPVGVSSTVDQITGKLRLAKRRPILNPKMRQFSKARK